MKFKTSSGIKSIVGRDLITDRYIAIFELVKNSYDARATEVIVSFNTSEDSNQCIGSLKDGKIYIVDNGKGMSKDDLENKWLFLAYSDKKEGQLHSNLERNESNDALRDLKNRAYVGSKGIGRFSSDSLGAIIKIHTKVASENIEHQLIVNWDDFELSLENRFESIDVKYESTNILSRNDTPSYTILEISDLRESWGSDEIDKVINKLRRLKNPFVNNDDLDIYCGVNIFEYRNYKKPSSKFVISSNISNVLKEKSINISAHIENGMSEISLIDRGNLIYKVIRNEKSILQNIDKLNISINYLTTSAKNTFTKSMGITPVKYGNVFIYLNNFQVSPYGEEHYDIFGLNIRKAQGYNRYLATRELIGFISIYDSNKYFKETSSRDNGFIENGYFKSLEDFYMQYIQRPLERYVSLIRWGESRDKEEITIHNLDIPINEKESFKRYISKDGFLIDYFNKEIDFEYNNTNKIIDRIANDPKVKSHNKEIVQDLNKLRKQFKELKNDEIQNKKDIDKKNVEITLLKNQNRNLINKRNEESYSEQITHHFKKLSARLSDSIRELFYFRTNLNGEDLNKFNLAIRKIIRTKQELTAFQDILTKTNIETRKGTTLNWIELFNWYFQDHYYEKLIVRVNCESENISKLWDIHNTNAVEVIMMLGNFLENAKEHGASILDFNFYNDYFTVVSDSNLIPDEYFEKVFELGFSTKFNGTGIGLNQIQMFLRKYKMSISVRNNNNFVEFTIRK